MSRAENNQIQSAITFVETEVVLLFGDSSLSDETKEVIFKTVHKYSKIPILGPPLGLSKSGLKDHFWTVPKVVSNQIYTGCRK